MARSFRNKVRSGYAEQLGRHLTVPRGSSQRLVDEFALETPELLLQGELDDGGISFPFASGRLSAAFQT